jgi:hypothetical protein
MAEVRAAVGQQGVQPMAHESGEPLTTGVSASAQEPAEPGVVLLNYIDRLGQFELSLARQGLPQPSGNPIESLESNQTRLAGRLHNGVS